MIGIYRLKNSIQKYAWGSRTAIPELLGKPSPSEEPQAELWMGTHPKAPSSVIVGSKNISLIELIRENPEKVLGSKVARKFSGTLPFLFKVLAAAKPLSIQAHPNLIQAKEGFTRENKLNIPFDAFNRSYKDNNHKPEIISALTPFWTIHGFRHIKEICEMFNAVPLKSIKHEINTFNKNANVQGLLHLFQILLTLPDEKKARAVKEAVFWADKIHNEGNGDLNPVKSWIKKLNQEYPGDIGVLCPLILNVVLLNPGDAIFTGAGEPHAYLDGVGVELMANSDNVLRGGLTPKYIDVPELIKILTFEPIEFNKAPLKYLPYGEKAYLSPAEEFMLSRILIHKEDVYKSADERNIEIMICTQGEAAVYEHGKAEGLSIKKGDSLLIPASVSRYTIKGSASIYKASVPL
jgi:mannose-6-phosphate isomerase